MDQPQEDVIFDKNETKNSEKSENPLNTKSNLNTKNLNTKNLNTKNLNTKNTLNSEVSALKTKSNLNMESTETKDNENTETLFYNSSAEIELAKSQAELELLRSHADLEAIKKEDALSGVVIAEFNLLSLDSPNAAAKNCEIITKKPYFLIGRGVHCDYRVTFKDKYVAEEQASIAYSIEDESYVIRCLAKDNPIFIDNKKVQNDQKLHSGSIIKLGVAANAPKLRFFVEGEEEVHRTHKKLSEVLKSLQRGKQYSVGGEDSFDINIGDPNISGATVTITVPLEGNHLILKKDPKSNVSISIDGSEVHINENRILGYQKCLEIGNFFTLVHDVNKFYIPRTPKKCLLSDFVPSPERGTVYTIGSNQDATFHIDDKNVPFLLVEIDASLEEDHFLIKKVGGYSIPVSIDTTVLEEDPRNGRRFGVNQILRVGDYWEIRNNHRSLPALKKGFMWGTFAKGVAICLVIACIALGIIWGIKEYTPNLSDMLNPQNTMELYQKNVFYIAAFDKKENASVASGTGFLWVQKDAYEQNIYYIVTCKHVIQPWKFEKHKKQDEFYVDENGKKIEEYSLALWPYNSEVIDPKSSSYIVQNSFNNFSMENKKGKVELYKLGKDEYEQDGEFIIHKKNSNGDLAILKITFESDKENYDYKDWKTVSKPQISVGEEVIVLGYSLGGGRLLNKSGIAKPVVCEGKVSSESIAPEFVELDVNQTSGSSGGPILNKDGEIIGVVSFSDSNKNLVYGIHGKVLEDLIR